jgi:hypothetical protein
MELNLSSWQSFSDICITRKNLNCQYSDISRAYRLLGPDANSITWVYDMPKTLVDGSANPEVALFLAASPAFNWAIGTRLYPAQSSDMMADDDKFSGVFLKSINGSDTITDVWFRFDHVNYVSGADFWTVGAKKGDWIQADVVDRDGVIPMPDYVADAYGAPHGTPFPANTVLSTYIIGRHLVPVDYEVEEFQRGYWAKPPVGCYIRIRGHILNTISDVELFCNIYKHKPI